MVSCNSGNAIRRRRDLTASGRRVVVEARFWSNGPRAVVRIASLPGNLNHDASLTSGDHRDSITVFDRLPTGRNIQQAKNLCCPLIVERVSFTKHSDEARRSCGADDVVVQGLSHGHTLIAQEHGMKR